MRKVPSYLCLRLRLRFHGETMELVGGTIIYLRGVLRIMKIIMIINNVLLTLRRNILVQLWSSHTFVPH